MSLFRFSEVTLNKTLTRVILYQLCFVEAAQVWHRMHLHFNNLLSKCKRVFEVRSPIIKYIGKWYKTLLYSSIHNGLEIINSHQ